MAPTQPTGEGGSSGAGSGGQGQGQGGGEGSRTPGDQGSGSGAGDGKPPGEGQEGKPPASADKRFSQDELDTIVKDRLEREQKSREAKAAKDREAAEAARLKEQGEFKSLSEQQQAKITQLESDIAKHGETAETLTRYQKAIGELVEQQSRDLPAYVTEAIAAMEPLAKLEYLTRNREAITGKRTAEPVPATPGAGGGANGTAARAVDADRTKQATRSVRGMW